jgi:wobble nucleotide-excising tRNase
MATTNKQILNNLYGLMLEINYHRDDDEILAELQAKPDALVDKHLAKVKQLTAKLKAEANRQRYQSAVQQLQMLKEKGIEQFKAMFSNTDQTKLVPMFNRFTELSQADEEAILEDQQMLEFLEILKNKADEAGHE